jgi:hypothetical protein
MYTDSQLIDDASLADINDGLWAGMSLAAEDALVIPSPASMDIKRAIPLGHSAIYGIDLAEAHFQDRLTHIRDAQTLLAS